MARVSLQFIVFIAYGRVVSILTESALPASLALRIVMVEIEEDVGVLASRESFVAHFPRQSYTSVCARSAGSNTMRQIQRLGLIRAMYWSKLYMTSRKAEWKTVGKQNRAS